MWSVPPDSAASSMAASTAFAAVGESSAPTTTVSNMGALYMARSGLSTGAPVARRGVDRSRGPAHRAGGTLGRHGRRRTARTDTVGSGRAPVRADAAATDPTDRPGALPAAAQHRVDRQPAGRAPYRVEPGTVVFVDISGFTKLSEGLAKHGKVGAEELTATIGTLLRRPARPGRRLRRPAAQVRRRRAPALLLGRRPRGAGLPGRGRDAPGPADGGPADRARAEGVAADVGGRPLGGLPLLPGRRRPTASSIVTGPAASTTVEMEGTADAGQIVVSPATAAALRPGLRGRGQGPGLPPPARPRGAGRRVRPVRGGRPGRRHPARAVPVGLRDALAARHQEPEHRRVTVAFIHFDGTDELVAVAGRGRGGRPARRAGAQRAGGRRPQRRDLPGHRRRPRRRQDHPDGGCPVHLGRRRAPDAAVRPRGHGRRQPAAASASGSTAARSSSARSARRTAARSPSWATPSTWRPG